jgi:hypothetical protein
MIALKKRTEIDLAVRAGGGGLIARRVATMVGVQNAADTVPPPPGQ